MKDASKFVASIERALRICLLLLALAAPVSIAVTQIFWSLALLCFLIRTVLVRPKFRKTAFELAILAFVGLTLLSSAFSYEPEVSLRKMVPVLLVTIVYLFSEFIESRKTLYKIVAALLIAGAFTCLYTFARLAIGKNLKVASLAADSPLRTSGVKEGDTILKANEQSVNSPDELAMAISSTASGEAAKLQIYRHEFLIDIALPTAALSNASISHERFGIIEWSRGRDTRASGTYGQYMTYAEVLQLLASLAFGLFIFSPGSIFARNRLLLMLLIAAFGAALLLTITRASWAAFAVSCVVMTVIGASRKTILIALVCAVPLAAAGLIYLQQKRNVGFIDAKDDSTQWRLTVWREGFEVLTDNPRHLLVGIGMDSLKTHWQDWGMFDGGKRPLGHLHSTPLQLAFERGVPALAAWLVWMFIFLKMLWRGLQRNDLEWIERGLLLGAFGGTIGFLTSGLVHYNWGDSEVVMVFYLLMGLALSILRRRSKVSEDQTNSQGFILNNV